MTRYEKYVDNKNWQKKLDKAKQNMKYRKEVHKEKARNRIYCFELFLLGILGISITRDASFLMFIFLGVIAWMETNKMKIDV